MAVKTDTTSASNIPESTYLKKLKLISINGNEFDLRPFFESLNIHYGITNCVSTGTLIFRDDLLGLLTNLPITGQEKLEVIFKTTTTDGKTSFLFRTFYVIGIANVTNEEEAVLVTLNIVDIAGYVSTDLRISYQFGLNANGTYRDSEIGAYNILKSILDIGVVKDITSFKSNSLDLSIPAKNSLSYTEFLTHYCGYADQENAGTTTKAVIELDETSDKAVKESFGKFRYTAANQPLISTIQHVTSIDAENLQSGFCDCLFFQSLSGKFIFSSWKKLYNNELAYQAQYVPKNQKLTSDYQHSTTGQRAITDIRMAGAAMDIIKLRRLGAFGMTVNMIDAKSHGTRNTALYYKFTADEILQRTSVSYVNKKCGDTKAKLYPNANPSPIFATKYEKYATVIYPANSLTDNDNSILQQEYMKKYALTPVGTEYQNLFTAYFVFESCNSIDVGDLFFINDSGEDFAWYSGYWLVKDCTITVTQATVSTVVTAVKNYYPFGGEVNAELNPYTAEKSASAYISGGGAASWNGSGVTPNTGISVQYNRNGDKVGYKSGAVSVNDAYKNAEKTSIIEYNVNGKTFKLELPFDTTGMSNEQILNKIQDEYIINYKNGVSENHTGMNSLYYDSETGTWKLPSTANCTNMASLAAIVSGDETAVSMLLQNNGSSYGSQDIIDRLAANKTDYEVITDLSQVKEGDIVCCVPGTASTDCTAGHVQYAFTDVDGTVKLYSCESKGVSIRTAASWKDSINRQTIIYRRKS